MKHTKRKLKLTGVALATLVASGASAMAQSSDAIIDKLVQKGILTVKEGNELRAESDKGFNQAYSVKTGLPDWVSAFKFSGDVRVRYESFFADDNYVANNKTNSFLTRTRFRYRLRFGAVVTMVDNLEAGFKLTSSDVASGGSNNEGDPISGNTTFQNNASKKLVYVDQAYFRWYGLNSPDWTGVLTIGKMESPFVLDDMVLDPDYTPEGGAIQLGYTLNDKHALKLNTGGFVLDEYTYSSNDPYLLAAQIRWDAKWNEKWASSLGVSILALQSAGMLTNNTVPNINRGNTRKSDGTLAYPYNPYVIDGAVTYTMASFPLYKGAFPLKVASEYMQNPAAPSGTDINGVSVDNYAWNVGVYFGKASKKGTWELDYTYKWLGANAWWEELVDSDFGAFYASPNAPANSGFTSASYGSGTNVKGHIMKFAYSPTDSLTLSAKWFLTDLINVFPSDPQNKSSTMNRVQVDASLKF